MFGIIARCIEHHRIGKRDTVLHESQLETLQALANGLLFQILTKQNSDLLIAAFSKMLPSQKPAGTIIRNHIIAQNGQLIDSRI